MKRIVKLTTNFYLLAGVCFLFWMLFIDSNNLVNQYTLTRKLYELEDRKEYYLERKEEIKADREELLSNPELMEKFAREKYLMKKESEDLYVIVKK